jgi:Adenylate and Guanylate cyclase catalytic domain
MAWNHDVSKKRVENHLDSLPEIEIKKLEREADLESLLSETTCREIYGVHVYLEVANFSDLTAASEEDGNLKPFLRALHIYQRQLSWIVENLFDGVRVQFQASRMHVLFYRPIDDAEELSAKAVLLMAVARDFLRFVFNPLFPKCDNLAVCAGADIGTVIGTRNGVRGDRELLFLGDPANHAAKIIDTGLRLTARVYDALPKDLKDVCEIADEAKKLYRIPVLPKDDLVALTETYGITWDRDEMKERIEADIDAMPLKDFEYSSAEELIDFERLSYRNNKRVLAASIFADVTGFTKFIGSAATEDEKVQALQALHVMRKEFTRVATQDYNAVRVQFQGDRMQAIVHLPEDDTKKIARKAVDIAVGVQSSMELVIKDVVDGIGSLGLSVGVDVGIVIATKLGARGRRDRMVVGSSVLGAAGNEERTSKRQIGVSKPVYSELDEDVQGYFSYDKSALCYVATGLTAAVLEKKSVAASVYDGRASVYVGSTSAGISVTREEVGGGSKVTPSRSHGE